jgi:hypothetical protein
LTVQLVRENKMRRSALLASATVAMATLTIAGSAAAAGAAKPAACAKTKAGQVCGATSGPLVATMVPSTHYPKINAKWPLTVSATLSGKPARASAVYEFLFGGVVVSTQYPRKNKHFMFDGHFSDTLPWPPASNLQQLTLQVVVKAGGHTVNLDWAVTPGKK